MGHDHTERHTAMLERRAQHLRDRLVGVNQGASMWDRRELGAIRYALGLQAAAGRLGLVSVLEADALVHGDIASSDTTHESRKLAEALRNGGTVSRPQDEGAGAL